jgi:hypothetical protein
MGGQPSYLCPLAPDTGGAPGFKIIYLRAPSLGPSMTTLWKCPDPDCAPSDIAPKELSTEEAVADRLAGDGPPEVMNVDQLADFLQVPRMAVYAGKSGA